MNHLSRRNFVLLSGSGVAALALGSPLLTRSAGAVGTPDAQMNTQR